MPKFDTELIKLYFLYLVNEHYATSRKDTGSRPDEVNEFV
jgi:hypothetical protein